MKFTLIVEVAGYRFAAEAGRLDPDQEPEAPERCGDVFASAERRPAPDHDHGEPVGFRTR